MNYLPRDASIEQACNWLQAKTGQTWVLARLLEYHLMPHFWLDYKPGYPALFGDRIEGYQTHMMFQGDLSRLESDGANALVNMFTAHDGRPVKAEPALNVPLSELRFKREALERVAEIINRETGEPEAQPQAAAHAPVKADDAGTKKKWTPEKLAEMADYRAAFGTKKTAEHYQISQQRIRQLLPGEKSKAKGASVFTYHNR